MESKWIENRRLRRARTSRERKISRRQCGLAAAAAGGTLLLTGHGAAAVAIGHVTAQDGQFHIAASGTSVADWTQELNTSGFGYGNEFISHLFEQSFYFRADAPGYDSSEHALSSLNLGSSGNFNPATNDYEGDSMFFEIGGGSGEPIQVDLEYELADTSTSTTISSTITTRLRITNTTTADLPVWWFMYSDLNLEGNPGGDVAKFFSGTNMIQQTSSIGSVVTTTVSSGTNPSIFAIEPYSDILDQLEDDQPTTFVNPSFNVGPGNVTHAFQWNYLIDQGSYVELEIVTEGTFTDVLAPANTNAEGEFVFDVADPPVIGDRPKWYDPEVAVGYDYSVGEGEDNTFAEVYLPLFGDGEYTLIVLDPDHPLYGQEITVYAIDGEDPDAPPSFDLTYLGDGDELTGAKAFRILGIEESLEIDPEDPTGFPTGLTFVNGNVVTFNQSAIVPEPATLALAGLAAAGLLVQRGRRS